MNDVNDAVHGCAQALAFEDPRPGGSLTADSQSLGLGSPPPLATGLFRGRFAGESESPSMASELESGRPSPAADSLEQAQTGLPTQRSKVGHTSILLTFARFWPKGMEVRPPCVPSYF